MATWLPKVVNAAKVFGKKVPYLGAAYMALDPIKGYDEAADIAAYGLTAPSAGPTGDIGGGSTQPAPQQQPSPNSGAQPAPKQKTQVNLGGTKEAGRRDDLLSLQNMQVDDIQAEFDDEISRLNKVKGGVQARYDDTRGRLQTYFPQFEALANQEKATQMNEIQNVENNRRQESTSALAQARQMLSDLQRRQTAYLSATGNYGSSVPEAMGEQFGRQAFSAIGNVQKQRDQSLAEVETMRAKAENFYSQKMLTARQDYDNQLANLETQFNAQLDAISNAKGAAASAKRAATTDAWRQYVNAKLVLDDNAAQTTQSIEAWKAQNDQELTGGNDFIDEGTAGIQPIERTSYADNVASFAFNQPQQNMQSTSQFSPIYTRGAKNPDDLMIQQLLGNIG